jgi:hypothetical protein
MLTSPSFGWFCQREQQGNPLRTPLAKIEYMFGYSVSEKSAFAKLVKFGAFRGKNCWGSLFFLLRAPGHTLPQTMAAVGNKIISPKIF